MKVLKAFHDDISCICLKNSYARDFKCLSNSQGYTGLFIYKLNRRVSGWTREYRGVTNNHNIRYFTLTWSPLPRDDNRSARLQVSNWDRHRRHRNNMASPPLPVHRTIYNHVLNSPILRYCRSMEDSHVCLSRQFQCRIGPERRESTLEQNITRRIGLNKIRYRHETVKRNCCGLRWLRTTGTKTW